MKSALAVFLLMSCSLQCQTPTAPVDKPTIPNLPDVNPQLLQLVVEDQWDRGNDMFGNRQVKTPLDVDVNKRDEERHAQVRKLLQDGHLKTGRDYSFAALIFQHSDKADDLMFGHVLAVTAISKGGDAMSKWLAAATLDRYLNTLGQPQVFGTQFHPVEGHRWTMDPYNRGALSDSERALWCVVSLAEQDGILKNMLSGGTGAPTQIKDCK